MRGEIPNAPFREAFITRYNKDEISLIDVTLALGRKRNETSYVQRMLGLRPYKAFKLGRNTYNKAGEFSDNPKISPKEAQTGWRYQVMLDYETAKKLCEVLDLDPVDVGI